MFRSIRQFFQMVLRNMDQSKARDEVISWQEHQENIAALLPDEYHTCGEPVSPTSMGSASLKYDADGNVAWGEIWTSFCGLAMGGGPPHKGSWLALTQAVSTEEDLAKSIEVGDEIRRAVRLTTGMRTLNGPKPGWITVLTSSEDMARWLCRAIIAENVMAYSTEYQLHLPSGPEFRVVKEIKNVVVALSKGFHYWTGHLSSKQRAKAGALLRGRPGDQPLPEPDPCPWEKDASGWVEWKAQLSKVLGDDLKLPLGPEKYPDWISVICPNESMSGWLVRSAIAENLVVRRETVQLYFPVGSVPLGEEALSKLGNKLTQLRRFWDEHGSR